MQRKGNFCDCWWEYKLVQLPRKTGWRVHKKLKIELLYGVAIKLLGVCQKERKFQRGICTFIFTAALFTIAKV